MPVRIAKNRDGSYRVSTPGGVKARATTLRNAVAQKRIIEQADTREALTRRRRA